MILVIIQADNIAYRKPVYCGPDTFGHIDYIP